MNRQIQECPADVVSLEIYNMASHPWFNPVGISTYFFPYHSIPSKKKKVINGSRYVVENQVQHLLD